MEVESEAQASKSPCTKEFFIDNASEFDFSDSPLRTTLKGHQPEAVKPMSFGVDIGDGTDWSPDARKCE